MKLKTRDIVTQGAIAGLAAGLPVLILSHILFLLGITTASSLHLAAAIELENVMQLTPAGIILAASVHTVVSAIFGVAVAILLFYTGSDFALFKGIGAGAFGDLALHNFLIQILRPELKLGSDAATGIAFFVLHALLGGLSAFFLIKFGKIPEKSCK